MTGWAIFLRGLNGVLMIAVPCLAAVLLVRRTRGGFRVIGIGVAGFILSQVGHLPFNQFLLLPGLQRWGVELAAPAGKSLWVLGAAAGLSAGLFEEFTRYLVFRFWLRERKGAYLPWEYGIGHGGIEAVLTGVLVLFAFVQVLVLGGEGVLAGFPVEQAKLIQSQLDAYWAVPLSQALLGAWERVSALLFHLGASVFVYKSVREKRPRWLLIAIIGHAFLNAFAVVVVRQVGLLLMELLLFGFGVFWVVWAWFVRPRQQAEQSWDPPPPRPNLSDRQVTADQIEESRYE